MTNSIICRSAALLALVFGAAGLVADDWPQFRGPHGTGMVDPGGILSRTSDVELKVRWKQPIGSGYSSVVVADGKVIALYSSGSDDVAGCFNAQDGDQIWQTRIGERFKGENGSFDGPISTPCIHNNRLYFFHPAGTLYCLSLADGSEIWSRNMVKEEQTRQPLYGFATSPIVLEETLIIQLGAEGKALIGIDLANGKTKWSVGTDSINSQSPAVMNAFGKQLILACGGKNLMGVTADGRVMFTQEHQGGNGSAVVPVVFDNQKVLLTLDDRHSTAFSVRPSDDDQMQASEEWQNRSIKNTYNVPVIMGNHAYAYSTRILTCVDTSTGRAVWKNRKPGDGFLVVADGHLIINTKKGSLHLAKATDSGFEEIDSLELFDDLVWSLPAVCGDTIYARSLGELACIDIVAKGTSPDATAPESMAVGPRFEQMINRVGNANDDATKQEIVDAFVAGLESAPYIENGIAHFLFQSDRNDVAVASDLFGARQETKLSRVEGTDLHYYATRLPSDQRVNYVYFVDYQPRLDPHNENTMTSTMYAGEMEFAVRLRGEKPLTMNWFGMPEWKQPAYLANVPESLAGKMVTHTYADAEPESEDADASGRPPQPPQPTEVQVYLPPGYDATDEHYPVIYVFGGSEAIEKGRLHRLLDNQFQIQPASRQAIVVFVDGFGPQFGERVAKMIVPSVDKNFRTQAERSGRACVGFGMMGGAPLLTAATHPDLFGAASADSPLVFDDQQQAVLEAMAKVEQPMNVRIAWGRYDMHNPVENWDLRTIAAKLADGMKSNKNLTLSGGMKNDSTDWSSWQNYLEEILALVQ